ncbi:fimbrial protein [Klebsiella indica]|uniref:fimbrial protein n=1 Tax=Klebsiella TaxID=570 RepID=UPI0031B6E4D0
MKKILLTSAFIALGLTSLSSLAKDGTVVFNGTITQSGCEVSNATDGTITVDMGNYSSSALATAGQTAGPKPFEIDLKECATGSVKVRFDGTAVSGNANLLALTATGAENDPASSVGIQVTDLSSGGVYTFGDSSNAVAYQTLDDTGALNIKMAARYYAYADGTPSGAANATTDFSIEYQ